MKASDVEAMHGLYCELTGQQGFGLRFGRDRVWWEWMQNGWGEDELRLVVRYLRKGIAEGKRNQGALKFSNLIGQPDRFEEDLLEARRVLNARPRKPATIVTTQRTGDGALRMVEVPRPTDNDVVDIRAAMDAMRAAIERA